MLTTDENVGEGVIGRRLVFCPRLEAMSMDKLIRSCDDCKDFFVYCCNCSQRFNNDGYRDSGRLCHHFRMIFTDGACRLNGQAGATAGLGVAFGEREEAQMSVPVTTVWDPDQKRTSQRAELLAAQAGLWWLIEADRLNNGEPDGKPKEKARKGRKGRDPNDQDDTKNWIIATDSEYVVKGITEWLPAWKKNNLRTNRNTKPANLDLFLDLDESITAEETKQDVNIGFWHVPREYNTIADKLAKKASLEGDPE